MDFHFQNILFLETSKRQSSLKHSSCCELMLLFFHGFFFLSSSPSVNMATRDATNMSGILITALIYSNTQKVYKTDLIKNCNHERLILRNTRNYELCSTFHVQSDVFWIHHNTMWVTLQSK